MKPYATLKTALGALRRNVLRSMLTTLGIVIGVAAVITMMEIGNGAALAIRRTIASIGANILVITPSSASAAGVSIGAGSLVTLTPQDADAVARECPAVAGVAPIVRVRTQVVHGNHNWAPTYIYGTTPSFLRVRQWTDLAEGEAFTEQDVRNSSKVCLIGQTVARELYGGRSPVGSEVRIRNVAFRVIGVLRPKGANVAGTDQDDIVLAPWTTIKYRVVAAASPGTGQESENAGKMYPTVQQNLYPVPSASQLADTPLPVRFTNVDQVLVAARSESQISPAIRQITALLRERHQLRANVPDDFNVRDMTEIYRAMTATTEMMTRLLLCVAMISLVVGGVGIMNIMLVSVTERTREIGLRMAVGAEPADILRQFLAEAVVLCLLGGAAGIAVGRGSSSVISRVMHWPTAPSFGAIVASVAVSASVGVIFGFYPAWKAARLNPIDALRYE
jgi:ABC-type antimicrobial peptide transport system permease subunit